MHLSRRIKSIVQGESDAWDLLYRARRMEAEGKPVINLTIGDHDIKTDRAILDAMHQSAVNGNLGYAPIFGPRALREAIADRVTTQTDTVTSADEVVVTAGGQAAIFAAMTAVLDPGDACVVLDPYYATFDATVRAVAADAILVPTLADADFQPDADLIEAALTPSCRALLINTPNNPTGAVYTRARLEAVAELCRRRDLWLISDELYASQVHEGVHVSPRDLPGMAERTIVIGSFSKSHAMTGARVGWIVGPRELVDCIGDLALTSTYGIPGFIQDAALFALTECAHIEEDIALRYKRRRDIALTSLGNGPGVRVTPPQGGMYLMLDIRETGVDGTTFATQMLEEFGIGIMPGESFGAAAAGHLRIALTAKEDELERAMKGIARHAAHLAAANAA